MKEKTFSTVMGVLLLVLTLAILPFRGECSPEKGAPPAPKTIRVGALLGLTGGDASTGAQMVEGYELAVEDINKDGGIYVKQFDKKIPIELITLDTETNPKKTMARAEALFAKYGVVASVGSTLIGAAAHIFEKNKVPTVIIANTIQALHERGYKYWFSASAKSPDYAKAIVRFLESIPKNIRPVKIALFVEQGDFSVELTGLVKEEATAKGYEVVTSEKYAMMAKDLSPLILSAKAAGAEAVIAAPIAPDGITMLRQMKELHYNPKIIIYARAAGDSSWGPAAGPLGDYVVSIDVWHPTLDYPGNAVLCAKYKAKFGRSTQSAYTGTSYANIQIIADAIKRAGTLDRDDIRNAIAATDLMTVGGPVKFRENGTMIAPVNFMGQWQSGVKELVWPGNLITKPLIYPLPEWSKR